MNECLFVREDNSPQPPCMHDCQGTRGRKLRPWCILMASMEAECGRYVITPSIVKSYLMEATQTTQVLVSPEDRIL
jgi:hypothetical protein